MDAAETVLFEPVDDDECGEDMVEDSAVEFKVGDITAALEPVELMKELTANEDEPAMKPTAVKVKAGTSSSLLRRLLKYSLPLPLLLVVLFGGLYLLCDGWHEALNDLGLLINPRLKYVRGAPPV